MRLCEVRADVAGWGRSRVGLAIVLAMMVWRRSSARWKIHRKGKTLGCRHTSNRHSREGGNPETSAPSLKFVIPANAGSALVRRQPNIQRRQAFSHEKPWIPASAGMTK
ncbi:hypothetical protein [Lysobacter gummosus]|uniref:hypothetical protein n=1 Tax=Lysobacter gummosus TaxID=262324 RepID=UPI003632C543